MKISFSTLACPWWSLRAVIEQARVLGFDGVELRFIENDDRLNERPEFRGSGLQETRERLRSAGLVISCLDTSCFFHYPEEERRNQSLEMGRAMIELAAELQAPGIRIFGDRIQPGADRVSTAGWITAGLHELAEFAQPAGVEVWLESHGDFASSSATLGVLLAAGGSSTGVVWDPLNAYSEFGEELREGWRQLAENVRHVHIKDARPLPGAPPNQPWEPVLVGEGNFPALDLVRLLRKHGYERFVSFEWEKRWHPGIPEPEIALPHFIRWMRAALEA